MSRLWLVVLLSACASAPPKPTPEDDLGAELDQRALKAFFDTHRTQIQDCYQQELEKTPGLKGGLTMMFTITHSSRATAIGIEEDTINNPTLNECLKALFSSWEFPFTPEKDVPIAYPFVFFPH